MNIGFVISTLFEIALGSFIIWGYFNEQKLVAFEDKLFLKLRGSAASLQEKL